MQRSSAAARRSRAAAAVRVVSKMSASPPAVQRIGQLKDGSGKPQSVTTHPEITKFTAGFRVLYFGTGRYLGPTDAGDPATLVPPLNFAYQQSVYAVKDTGTDLGDLRLPAAGLVQQTLSVLAGSTSRTTSTNDVDWNTQNGWYMDFNPANNSPGERVTIDPQLVRGVLVVVTNEPTSDACSAGGLARLYQLDYKAGTYTAASGTVASVIIGDALAAGFVIYHIPSGQLKLTEISVKGDTTTQGINPGGGAASGTRASWRELVQ